MIQLTRLNGHPLLVNCDLIKLAESIPDTTLTLITGEKLVVLEACDEVQQRIQTWRADLLRSAWPTAESCLTATAAAEAARAQSKAETEA